MCLCLCLYVYAMSMSLFLSAIVFVYVYAYVYMCNEPYGTLTTTLSSRNQRTALMQKIIKLYTHSHNYSNTEVRRATNSLNPTMVFDNMHEHSSHLSFYKQRKRKRTN